MGWGKKVQANHPRRIRHTCGHLINVQIRGVGGQNSICRHNSLEPSEYLCLHLHALKSRLYGQHRIGGLGIVGCGCKAVLPILRLGLSDQPARETCLNNLR